MGWRVGNDSHDGSHTNAMRRISFRHVSGEQHQRRREVDLQNTEQKDAAQFKSLPDRNLQPPHHRQWQKKDEEVEDQIADSIPSEKCDHVHAVSSDCLIPVSCEGGATEESQDSTSNPEAANNEASPPKRDAEGFYHTKDSIVQKQKGGLGQNCVQKVERLDADKSL